jgi:hypothetical protein
VTDPADPSKSVCKTVDATCPMACATGQACVAQACVASLAPVAAPTFFLDTNPYNAHTTASDALWAGYRC